MRVIVLKDAETFYKTAAFAIRYDGWKTEFFVINDKREFEWIYEYSQDKLKVEKRSDFMRIHYVKPLRVLMIIFISIIMTFLTIYIYLGFTHRFPSKEVYLAGIIYPILISPILVLFIIDLIVLKNNKIKNNKGHNVLCIVNFVLLSFLPISVMLSFYVFIYGGHGCSYTERYSDYSKIMKEESYYTNIPYFMEDEIKTFKYYENFIDSHQEDFFVELVYDDEEQFNNSLVRIKNHMKNYIVETNTFNDSYNDIFYSNKMNSYEIFKIGNTYEVKGEYLVASYETRSKTIIISYWNFESDEFIDEHNPFLFKYFNYIP